MFPAEGTPMSQGQSASSLLAERHVARAGGVELRDGGEDTDHMGPFRHYNGVKWGAPVDTEQRSHT